MARVRRGELFHSAEIAAVHVMSRVVRRCFLMGDDPVTGKNYDHRKQWIEQLLERFAACFGIDLIAFSLMRNHMHLVLRSRPDIVATWEDREVAMRWLKICPPRRCSEGTQEPTEADISSICSDEDRLREIRTRLSDISWWMRLICQRISIRANTEEQMTGRFWEGRFKSVRLLDEEAILACAAYVDLNPIRAALAETIEKSDFTSGQRRIQAFLQKRDDGQASHNTVAKVALRDAMLCPVYLDGRSKEAIGPMPSSSGRRCSDKGWTALSEADYLQLLDWTARRVAPGKRGATPHDTPPVFDRLKLSPESWSVLVTQFEVLFSLVAGQSHRILEYQAQIRRQRFKMKSEARQQLV